MSIPDCITHYLTEHTVDLSFQSFLHGILTHNSEPIINNLPTLHAEKGSWYFCFSHIFSNSPFLTRRVVFVFIEVKTRLGPQGKGAMTSYAKIASMLYLTENMNFHESVSV